MTLTERPNGRFCRAVNCKLVKACATLSSLAASQVYTIRLVYSYVRNFHLLCAGEAFKRNPKRLDGSANARSSHSCDPNPEKSAFINKLYSFVRFDAPFSLYLYETV